MIKRYICFTAKLSWKDFHYIDYMEMTFMMSMKALFYMKFFSNLKIISGDVERVLSGWPMIIISLHRK